MSVLTQGRGPKVAFDLRWISRDSGGITTYALLLLQALVKREPEFQLTAILNPGTEGLVERYLSESIPSLRTLFVPYSLFSLSNQLRLASDLRRQHFAIYHSPTYLGLAKGGGLKVIVTVHDLNMYHYPRAIPGTKTARLHALFTVALRCSLRRANVITTGSQTAADDIRRSFPVEGRKVQLVHSIVNPLFFRPRSREEKDALRRRYGITGQLAVYVGRRAPYKNVTALLRAVKLLRLQKRDLKLLLAGDPDGYHPEQEMRASGEHPDEYAFFPGFLLPVELATLYQTADVLVFPSELEGFGLPPLEAMASGTPVVCSTCEVLRETAGTAALFTEPAPEALANAIGRVIDNPDLRSDLIQRGWEQAALYSPDSAAESILGIYRRLTSVG